LASRLLEDIAEHGAAGAMASSMAITVPRTSGRAASHRSALPVPAKRLRTGQQPEHAAPPPAVPLTTTASGGCQRRFPSGSSWMTISSCVSGSREEISIGSPNIGAMPRASIAHIAYTSWPSKRTRCAVGRPENG